MCLAMFFSTALLGNIFQTPQLRCCDYDQYRNILRGKLPKGDKRYNTFLQAFQLMEDRDIKIIVETGTARDGKMNFKGDGGSTILFSEWVSFHPDSHLYSVDINKQNLAEAEKAIVNKNTVTFVHEDAIHFLKNFKETIDFLYLDSCDYDYRAPHLSQQHHLKEIEAAYNKLSRHAIVMIDDCALPYGGKGKLVIEYLKSRGWKKAIDAYQVIMTRT
jgi:hypothetical protein